MILLLDVGNTNIVFGTYDKDKTKNIKEISRISSKPLKTEDEYSVLIKNILELKNINLDGISGTIISSVTPLVTANLKKACYMLFNTNPLVVGSGIKTGLNILIDNPKELGSDLVVSAVAAINCYHTPVIVVDLGTATTISVINNKSDYIGGMICPGINISLKSLGDAAALLPHIDVENNTKLIGTNTISCITSGVLNGHTCMIDGLIDRIKSENPNKDYSIIATGGLSNLIMVNSRQNVILDKILILKGLATIYDKNIE